MANKQRCKAGKEPKVADDHAVTETRLSFMNLATEVRFEVYHHLCGAMSCAAIDLLLWRASAADVLVYDAFKSLRSTCITLREEVDAFLMDMNCKTLTIPWTQPSMQPDFWNAGGLHSQDLEYIEIVCPPLKQLSRENRAEWRHFVNEIRGWPWSTMPPVKMIYFIVTTHEAYNSAYKLNMCTERDQVYPKNYMDESAPRLGTEYWGPLCNTLRPAELKLRACLPPAVAQSVSFRSPLQYMWSYCQTSDLSAKCHKLRPVRALVAGLERPQEPRS